MLSIIIPTLNEEDYLPLLLESIKKQNFTGDLEIIVADADSVDKTVEIAKSYGCKITAGGLPAKGRNQGAEIARGDLFLFLDAETLLPEKFLEKIILKFKERNLDVAGCGLEPIEIEWVPKIIFPKFFYDLLYNWPAKFLENALPFASSLILVKKEIHWQLKGGFDEGIKIAEDHNYVRSAAKISKFGFLGSFKLPFFSRRCQKQGILKTFLKYLFCNFFNLSLGDVRTDIFNYNFGQYKNLERKKNFKKLNSIFQFFWILACYIVVIIGLTSWLIIFLIFSPKLIILRVQSLFKKQKK